VWIVPHKGKASDVLADPDLARLTYGTNHCNEVGSTWNSCPKVLTGASSQAKTT
jgi:hypothetical protein